LSIIFLGVSLTASFFCFSLLQSALKLLKPENSISFELLAKIIKGRVNISKIFKYPILVKPVFNECDPQNDSDSDDFEEEEEEEEEEDNNLNNYDSLDDDDDNNNNNNISNDILSKEADEKLPGPFTTMAEHNILSQRFWNKPELQNPNGENNNNIVDTMIHTVLEEELFDYVSISKKTNLDIKKKN
jgi:hypothetical protein